MRVIAGSKRGFRLSNTNNLKNRSTLDRVKESMFNLLYTCHIPINVLDLFAGSGALGIESLSRGASFCTFVEISYNAIKTINYNINYTNFTNFSKIVRSNSFDFINKTDEFFDTIFLDPPFNMKILNKTIYQIMKNKILSKDGVIVVEHRNEEINNEEVFCIKQRKYGKIGVSVYKGINDNLS